MAKREKRERGRWDRPLERIGFHGVTQEEVSGGRACQATGRKEPAAGVGTRDGRASGV
jgi:hypothetical protein